MPRPGTAVVVAHDAVDNASRACGCHPYIVERWWGRLAAALVDESRCIVHGLSALVHSRSGMVVAVFLDTILSAASVR